MITMIGFFERVCHRSLYIKSPLYYIKSSSSLSKNDVNNKVRTPLERTYRAPARVVLRLRTYSVKA